MITRWQSFINCFNGKEKQIEFKKLSLLELEKREFYKLRKMYKNGQFVGSNKDGKKLYDRMRTLAKKFNLSY